MTELLATVGLLAAMYLTARLYPSPTRYIPIGRGILYVAPPDTRVGFDGEWTEIGYTEGVTLTRVLDDDVWTLKDWTDTFRKTELTMSGVASNIEEFAAAFGIMLDEEEE